MFDMNTAKSAGAYANQQYQAAGLGTMQQLGMNQLQGVPPQPPQPSTLMRALSRTEELNNRLTDLGKSVLEIAIAIGGPWPCDTCGGKPSEANPPAMTILNDGIDCAHAKVSDIEQAIHAIRRTLGSS